MALPTFPSPWMTDEHRMLQESAARCIAERRTPRAAEFRESGSMPPEVWREAGANGLLCVSTPAGHGHMVEYPIAEMYADARVQRIYGGTNEIMKELASRFM